MRRSRAAVAFVLDSGSWVTGGAIEGAVEDRLRLLREAGWTALAVAPGAQLSDLWRQAGRERTESSGSGTNGFSGGWS